MEGMNSKKKTLRFQIKRYLYYVRSFFPLFLSHHPECDRFEAHTLKIGKTRLCIGCFVAYPTGLFSLTLFNVLQLDLLLSPLLLLLFSFLFNITLFLSFTKLTEIKIIKVFQKASIAIGVALLLIWIKALPFSRNTQISLSISIIWTYLILFNFKHMFTFLNICYNCPLIFRWGECPGFETMRNYWESHNLMNILLSMEEFSLKMKKKKEKGKRLFL